MAVIYINIIIYLVLRLRGFPESEKFSKGPGGKRQGSKNSKENTSV